jgi:endoglucanase
MRAPAKSSTLSMNTPSLSAKNIPEKPSRCFYGLRAGFFRHGHSLHGLLVSLLLFSCMGRAASQFKPLDAFEQNHRLGRGVNIIGYDPLWRSRAEARFQEKHFQLLKEAGFQSVRVNLAPFRHMDSTNGWKLRRSWFETLDWVIGNANAQGLQVILDCHEYNRMGEDPAALKPQFLAFWKQLSEHCRNAPNSVLFEILNEPNKNLTPKLWNQYLREALTIIRATNPSRTVVVGPAFWNSVDHLNELELPEEDLHLIVTVHYYKPMSFTHQGAAWTNQKDKTGIAWGSEAERKAVRDDFARVTAWAKANNRPIFLGEFGAYDKAPMDARVLYTDFVARTAEASGWSWAYWQFDSDFILWDMKSDKWVKPILDALIPASKNPSQ